MDNQMTIDQVQIELGITRQRLLQEIEHNISLNRMIHEKDTEIKQLNELLNTKEDTE